MTNCIDTISPGWLHRVAAWLDTRFGYKAAPTRVRDVARTTGTPPRSDAPAMLMLSRDVRPLATRVAGRLDEWERRSRSRRALMTLDDRMLRDIGIDRATAHEEFRKPFWR